MEDFNASGLTYEFSEVGLARNLGGVDALIFCPHAVQVVIDDVRARTVAASFPEGSATRKFLEQDPCVDELLRFSQYRADGGADEIANALAQRLTDAGLAWVLVRPNPAIGFGRGVLDFNRPTFKAVGDGGIVLPLQVDAELKAVHEASVRSLFGMFNDMTGLKVVFQPHTMASGDPNMGEYNHLMGKVKEIPPSQGSTFDNSGLVQEVLTLWSSLYDQMNQAKDRDGVCVPAQFYNPTLQDVDGPLLTNPRLLGNFMESLGAQGFTVKKNDPFPHMRGYVGSELADLATKRGIPDLTMDIPRRFLLQVPQAEDPQRKVSLTSFVPDPDQVQIFAKAAFGAFRSLA